jgi:hypothetical protein
LLEVIVIILADDRMIAIHAMNLRRHFYELLPFDPRSVDSPRAIATVENGIRTDGVEPHASCPRP